MIIKIKFKTSQVQREIRTSIPRVSNQRFLPQIIFPSHLDDPYAMATQEPQIIGQKNN